MGGSEAARPPRGAYGFRIRGLEEADALLLDVEPDWPLLSVGWKHDPSPPPPRPPGHDPETATGTVRFVDGGAVCDLGLAGVFDLRWAPPVATLRSREKPDIRALVHPYLASAASTFAYWHRREVFHGGAFIRGPAAWVVLGERTAGKSSLLGALHASGEPILADDLVVVTDGDAYAAPRSLDLRADAAERLGIGEGIGLVGARERWRVELPAVPAKVPLGGFVFPAWADEVGLSSLGARERLARLSGFLTIVGVAADAASLLELASLPAFELRRPRDWGALTESVAALLDGVPG